jgi:hypothetical protein
MQFIRKTTDSADSYDPRRDALFLALAVALVALYRMAAGGGGFPLDDSWIHQVYGRNLGLYGQWAFVLGTPSAASTSPVYTVLLSIGYRLGVDFKLWTHLLGALALAGAGMLGARLAERLAPAVRGIGLLTGLALVFSWHLIWAASSGMETMLFGTWTLTLLLGGWRELDEARSTVPVQVALRGFGFGALTALATLTRPEGIVLAGLVGLLVLVLHPHRRGALVWAVGAGVGFLLFVAPYGVYNLRLTGGLLPDTAAAKQAENAPLLLEPYLARFNTMLTPILAGAQLFLLPGVVYALVVVLRRVPAERKAVYGLLLPFWSLALIGLYAARLPGPYQHGRYVIPALPTAIIFGVVGTAWLVEAARRSLAGRVLTRTLAISTALALVYFAFVAGLGAYRQDVSIIDQEMVAAAQWVAANVPADAPLAVHDIGAIGYFAPRPLLDLAGLVSPEIVPFILQKEAVWDWMYGKGAHYFVGFPYQAPGGDGSDSRLCPVYSTDGATSKLVGQPNFMVYRLAWDGRCNR